MDAARLDDVNPDVTFQRSFPAVLCGLIAAAAYFQASGISALLGAVELAHLPEAAPPRMPPPRILEPSDHATSAALILGRNPFDSVTGPLDHSEVHPGAAPAVASVVADPFEDPPCESARVQLIVASDDPAWAFASITGTKGQTMLRRVGDAIDGQTVKAITWDRVWLTGAGPRCQLRLGDKAALPKMPPPAAPTAPRARPGALPPDIAAKIHKINDHEFNVDRSALDAILEKQGELTRTTRIFPVREGDRVTGFRLMRVEGDSLLGTLGLKTGDQIKSINGFDLTDPQKALEAYSKLRSADNLALAIQRAGKDSTIDFHFR